MKRLAIIMSIFFSLLVFSDSAYAQQEPGNLVKSPDNTAVYYIGEDGKRHAFPNQKIYHSWYSDFSNVHVITEAELASFPLGKNVLYRPGSRLIKIPSVPEVYAVEPWGILRNLPSEEVAQQLYGDDWAKKVDDVDVSFFFDYTIGGVVSVIDGTAVYPRGTLLYHDEQQFLADRRTDGIHLLRPISRDGFKANNLTRVKVEIFSQGTKPQFYEEGLPLVYGEAAFSCVWCDAQDYQKISVQQTELHAGNGLSLEIPKSWGVLFEGIAEDDLPRLLLAVEKVDTGDGFPENLTVFDWSSSDYDDDLWNLSLQIAGLNDHVAYLGESLTHETAIEVTGTRGEILYRNHLFPIGKHFYQVQFSSNKKYAERYHDVLDVMLKTISLPAT